MKKGAENLKTRPDLDDETWLVWVSAQPENRGLFVREMYRKMLEWCQKKGVTPTRRRLLKWLDGEREAMPMTYKPAYFEPEPTPAGPTCAACNDSGEITRQPENAKYDWDLEFVPCPDCNKEAI